MYRRFTNFYVYFMIGVVFTIGNVYAQPPDISKNTVKIIDMSHVLYPGKESRKFTIDMVGADEVNPNVIRLKNQWYIMHNINLVSHIGTHIEVPYHILRDGDDLARFPLENLCGEAVVLDLRECSPGSAITVKQIEISAQKAGGIKRGDIVLCNSGYARHYGTTEYNQAPYFSNEAIEWLVNKGMKMMAIDSKLEVPGSEEHENHHTLLDNGIPVIENITGFDRLTRIRVQLYAFPIAVKGLESFPLRVVAIEED